MIGLFPPKFDVHVGRSHPTLRTMRYKIEKKRAGKCVSLAIKAREDWRDVGRPQVAVHRNCHLLYKFFSVSKG